MKRTAEFVARAQELRAQGMLYREIAVELDAGTTTIGKALNRGPGISTEERSALGRDLWRDHVFGGEDRQIWTRERIIAAIRAWARRTGEPPSAADWHRPNGRGRVSLTTPGRASRPTVPTVRHFFGSWNAAIEAAGFEPRRQWARPRRRGRCKNGHLIAEVGLVGRGRRQAPGGTCGECDRIRDRRRRRERAAARLAALEAKVASGQKLTHDEISALGRLRVRRDREQARTIDGDAQ